VGVAAKSAQGVAVEDVHNKPLKTYSYEILNAPRIPTKAEMPAVLQWRRNVRDCATILFQREPCAYNACANCIHCRFDKTKS
jgi:hypothetical protein